MTAPERIRLLMTTDAVGGVWTYALDLARGLAPHGVRTTLAVLGPAPSADQVAAAAAVPGLRLLPTDLPLEWLAEAAMPVEASGRAIAALAAEADLVHLNAPGPVAGARFPVPLVVACHSCVATWWHSVRGGPLPEDFRWRAALVERAYRAADLLVAPTAAFATATAQVYRLPAAPMVIHNGRRILPPSSPPVSAPAEFAFTAGRLWDEGKNLAVLDRAAARLPFPVLAAGALEGPNGTCARLPHLRALGHLPEAEMARWLAAQPIYVSPARYEPFGLAVLEAAQAGCALVLSDTPGFRELWQDAAAFVPAEDDVALAETVLQVAQDRERRTALGVAARERAERYTVERQVAGMLDAYRRLLRGSDRGTGRNVAV